MVLCIGIDEPVCILKRELCYPGGLLGGKSGSKNMSERNIVTRKDNGLGWGQWNSLEKTLMLRKIEGKRRGQHRMR